MSSSRSTPYETGAGAGLPGAALATAVALVAAAAAAGPLAGQQQATGDPPVARVGLSEDFSAALDSAPETVDWEMLRQTVALRYVPGGDVASDPSRKHLVLHAAILHQGSIQERYDSEEIELLPGATKFDPDALLPEDSMIPDGYRISGTMGFGVVDLPAGQIMSDLLRDIVMPMAESAPALWLVATPPEEDFTETHKSYPVLLQLAPVSGDGGSGG